MTRTYKKYHDRSPPSSRPTTAGLDQDVLPPIPSSPSLFQPLQLPSMAFQKPLTIDTWPAFRPDTAEHVTGAPIPRTGWLEKFPEDKRKPKRYLFIAGRKIRLWKILLPLALFCIGLLLTLVFCIPRALQVNVKLTSAESVYTLDKKRTGNITSHIALLVNVTVDIRSDNFYSMTAEELRFKAYAVTNDVTDPISFVVPNIVVAPRSTRRIQKQILLPIPSDRSAKSDLSVSFRCLADRLRIEYDAVLVQSHKTVTAEGQLSIDCPLKKMLGGSIRSFFNRKIKALKNLIT